MNGPHPARAAQLVDAIERLQMGIFTNLLLVYSQRLPHQEALVLADCVLSHALLVPPIGDEARRYSESHEQVVQREAKQLVELPDVAEALSYGYKAPRQKRALEPRQRNSEILADLSSQIVVDFGVAGNSGGFSRRAIHEHRMAAALSEQLATVLFEMANQRSALYAPIFSRSRMTSPP